MTVRSRQAHSHTTASARDLVAADLAALIASLTGDLAPGSLRIEALFDRIEVRA